MDNKNTNPPSGDDTSWLDELLASSDYGEDAIADLSQSVEDMELERIIRSIKDEDSNVWESSPAEPAEPVYEAPVTPKPAFENPEIVAQVTWEDDETILPEEPEEEPPVESDRKVRPKQKNGYGLFGLPHLASVLIWIGIVVFLASPVYRLLKIRCPHCGSRMLSCRVFPKCCPDCGAELK